MYVCMYVCMCWLVDTVLWLLFAFSIVSCDLCGVLCVWYLCNDRYGYLVNLAIYLVSKLIVLLNNH